MNCVLIVF
jgi:asparaginyl-tRNA synthetase